MQIRLDGWQWLGVIYLMVLFIGLAGYEACVWYGSAEQIDEAYVEQMDQCNGLFLSEELMRQNMESGDEFQKEDFEVGKRFNICRGNETLLRKIRIDRLKDEIFHTWIIVVFGLIVFGVGWELSGVRD